MSDYNYQYTVANKIIKDFENKAIEASVLAATPGSGKTTISQIVINNYLTKYPNTKVLVLTHGQNVLKNQYLDNLRNSFIKINFNFVDFNKTAKDIDSYQVFVGLPQSLKKIKLPKIDLLIVDECHQFYLKPLVSNIIKQLKPTHQLLMTGSPSEFIKINNLKNRYEINFIAGEDLMKKGVFSSVVMEVISTKKEDPIDVKLTKMMVHARQDNMNLSKIMIAVNTVEEGFIVASKLSSMGRKIALSTVKNDPEGREIGRFKNNECDTLIVVNRGVLGFSDNEITGMFDLKCSSNLDTSNQLFSRVLRKHPKGITKFYYRHGDRSAKDFNNQFIMLHKIKDLMKNSIYKRYDGTNLVVRFV